MSHIDEQTKAVRILAVRNALASSRLEGARPTENTRHNLDLYVEGRASIDDLVAEVKRRYVRR